MARLPDFDPERDGNPFEWIVRQAQAIRAARQDARPGRFTPGDRSSMKASDDQIDAEEVARFAILRAKNGRGATGKVAKKKRP